MDAAQTRLRVMRSIGFDATPYADVLTAYQRQWGGGQVTSEAIGGLVHGLIEIGFVDFSPKGMNPPATIKMVWLTEEGKRRLREIASAESDLAGAQETLESIRSRIGVIRQEGYVSDDEKKVLEEAGHNVSIKENALRGLMERPTG